MQWNVAFFGQHQMKGSLKWMGAFWVSVAGAFWKPMCSTVQGSVRCKAECLM